MSVTSRFHLKRVLREAEGYLELGMARHALEAIGQVDRAQAEKSHQLLYLKGEALRSLEQYGQALAALKKAADLAPSDIHVWLAMGWCYKRLGRLDLAIKALQSAVSVEPDMAILHYNLACYFSLAGDKQSMLEFLSQAFMLDRKYRDLVGDEADFDPFRNDADFQALTSVIV